jgi:hypothetical protein
MTPAAVVRRVLDSIDGIEVDADANHGGEIAKKEKPSAEVLGMRKYLGL